MVSFGPGFVSPRKRALVATPPGCLTEDADSMPAAPSEALEDLLQEKVLAQRFRMHNLEERLRKAREAPKAPPEPGPSAPSSSSGIIAAVSPRPNLPTPTGHPAAGYMKPSGELAPWHVPVPSPQAITFAQRFSHTGTAWPTVFDGWLMSSPRADVRSLPQRQPDDELGTAHPKPLHAMFAYCDGGRRGMVNTPGIPGFPQLLPASRWVDPTASSQ